MSLGSATGKKIVRFCFRRLYYVYVLVVVVRLYKILNYKQKKILLFTDSRGFDVNKKTFFINPFDCYPGLLIKEYNVDFCICPEKHTTIIDFLTRYLDKVNDYDYIILHAGIVDFSPRHKSVAKLMYEQKSWYDKVFGKQNMHRHLAGDLGVEYEGEPLINMFSLPMAEEFLIPVLSKIRNLIWIGCNPFVNGWEGNYPKARPKNIRLVEEYSHLFIRELPHSIDLSNWNDDDVRTYTCDNIHLTKPGAYEIFKRIKDKLAWIQKIPRT